MVVLTSRQPVAAETTTGSSVPISTWRTTIGRAAAGAHAVPAGQLAALGDELEPLAARVLEVVGLLDRVDRADVDALVAQDAAALVDLERGQLALVEGERAGGAGGDAAAAGDAVGELQGVAVGRVDVDREAAAR